MTTCFISRHPGAREWANKQGITVDVMVDHLDFTLVNPGDTVIGTLPVHLAAEVCARGGRYFHLALETPSDRRGSELNADDLNQFGARIEEYWIKRL
jgi:CRISPR-associated protein Csx16